MCHEVRKSGSGEVWPVGYEKEFGSVCKLGEEHGLAHG